MHKTKTTTALAAIVLLAGCATNVQKPTTMRNPAPSIAFSEFTKFELRPINTTESCKKQHGADEALQSVQTRLTGRLDPRIAEGMRRERVQLSASSSSNRSVRMPS